MVGFGSRVESVQVAFGISPSMRSMNQSLILSLVVALLAAADAETILKEETKTVLATPTDEDPSDPQLEPRMLLSG